MTSDRPPRASAPGRAEWVLLGIGVVTASVSAILVRYAGEADPLAISFWRCALGAGALVPFAWPGLRRAARRELALGAVAGLFLALHFATWITSVGLTTVAASVLLVSTTPVFTALAARFLFAERLPRAIWTGIALALGGTTLVALGGGSGGRVTLFGNVLALLGAATGAGYFMAGAAARRSMGILPYAVVAYAVAGVVVLVPCVAAGIPLGGFAGATWWAIAAIVVGPQLLGHTLINSALKDVDSTTIGVILLVEPLIAAGLAYAFFAETPSALLYPGGVAVLAGIYLVTRSRTPAPVVVE